MLTFSRLRRWSRLTFVIALLAVAAAGVFLLAPAPVEASGLSCPSFPCGPGHVEIIGLYVCCVHDCPWGQEISICHNL